MKEVLEFRPREWSILTYKKIEFKEKTGVLDKCLPYQMPTL